MRLLAAALFLFLSSPANADVLIDNVTGLTLDEQGEVATFNAVLIGDDGRIADVYERKAKRPKEVEFRVDGKGRVMIPGLIDSHAQVIEFGLDLLKSKAGVETDPQGKPRPEDRDLAFAEAQDRYLASGFTTVADMGTTIDDWQTYRRFGDRGALRIRLVAYAEGVADMALIGGPGPTPWLYDGRLKQVGVVIGLDGPLRSRKAWLKAPYVGGASRGESAMSEVQLKNLMSRGAIDNFQVAVRAHGDASVSAVIDGIDDVRQTYIGDRRWRIEGADLVDAADVARLGATGAIASVQLAGLNVDATSALVGPEREASLHRWRSLADTGLLLALGSGRNSRQPLPFAMMASAMTRQRAPDQPLSTWQPQERLLLDDALSAFTTNGAKALFAEERIGRIAKGLEADFLFIDRDPLVASPGDLAKTRVLESWIGGVKVYDAGSEQGRAAIESFEGR